LEFISPRIESSFTFWLKSLWDYAIEEDRIVGLEGYIPELQAVFVLESLWSGKDEGKLGLWIRDEGKIPLVLDYMFCLSKKLGFKTLRILVEERLYHNYFSKYPHEVLSKELVLMKRLTK